MCGIAGIVDPTNTYGEAHLKKMTDALSHRGPDGEGFWHDHDTHIHLGHRRLSIIDLTNAASQPLIYLDRYVIIHNGEIYNYKELREQLKKFGYTFVSESDTEVIPALWDKYGTTALRYLDGMFAFVLYDRSEKTIYFARDRFGEKPLYYIHNIVDHTLLFASEMKAFKAMGIQLKADPSKVLHFIGTGAVSSYKDAVYYQNIHQVPAASCMKFELNSKKISTHKYWNPSIHQEKPMLLSDAITHFQEHFLQSIRLRMRSDVALGTSLSGGLDSASIVAGIQQLKELPSSYKHQSFTATFPGFDKDESDAAALIAATFHLNTNIVTPNIDSFTQNFDQFVLHHEEPIQSASVYAQYQVYNAAKEAGVKVLLDGQGADELLGGYNKYDHWYLQDLWRQFKFGKWKKELAALKTSHPNLIWNHKNILATYFPAWAAWMLKRKAIENIFHNPWINKDFCNEHLDKSLLQKPVIHSLNEILTYNSLEVGLPELLRYADKNAMAHGIEVRLPFLQHELASFLMNLPAGFKIYSGYHKWILRNLMKGLLPESILWNRNKIGFEPPQKQWMNTPAMREKIHEARKTLVHLGILNPNILNLPIQTHDAYDPLGMDWRILVTGTLLKSL